MIIEETARVVALAGDQAWVVTQRRSTCQSCGANKTCGTGIMSKAFSSGKTLKIKASNLANAVVGDEVILGIDDRVLLRSAVMMYLLPLFALMAGAFIGEWLNDSFFLADNEYLSLFGGVVAMIAVFYRLRINNKLLANSGDYQPRILRVSTTRVVIEAH